MTVAVLVPGEIVDDDAPLSQRGTNCDQSVHGTGTVTLFDGAMAYHHRGKAPGGAINSDGGLERTRLVRSEEHTSELQSLMRISYAVFCLKKKKTPTIRITLPTKQRITHTIHPNIHS